MSKKVCSICLCNINNTQAKKTKCNHIFHEKCLKKWFQFKNTCPLCRKILKNTITVNLFLDSIHYKDIKLVVKQKKIIFKLSNTQQYVIGYTTIKRLKLNYNTMDIFYSINKKLVKLKIFSENIFKVYELIKTTIENQLPFS